MNTQYEIHCCKCNIAFEIPFPTERSVCCPNCFKTINEEEKIMLIVVDMNHGRKKKKKLAGDDRKSYSAWVFDQIAYSNDGKALFESHMRR